MSRVRVSAFVGGVDLESEGGFAGWRDFAGGGEFDLAGEEFLGVAAVVFDDFGWEGEHSREGAEGDDWE